jgi:tRNA uridine 5-carboxymethylaminomethyl modification enzyme
VRQDGVRRSVLELLALPGVQHRHAGRNLAELSEIQPAIAEQLEIDAHYAGYLDRQEADIIAFGGTKGSICRRSWITPRIVGLSTECRLKLSPCARAP